MRLWSKMRSPTLPFGYYAAVHCILGGNGDMASCKNIAMGSDRSPRKVGSDETFGLPVKFHLTPLFLIANLRSPGRATPG